MSFGRLCAMGRSFGKLDSQPKEQSGAPALGGNERLGARLKSRGGGVAPPSYVPTFTFWDS